MIKDLHTEIIFLEKFFLTLILYGKNEGGVIHLAKYQVVYFLHFRE